jgi:hypothetical protein
VLRKIARPMFIGSAAATTVFLIMGMSNAGNVGWTIFCGAFYLGVVLTEKEKKGKKR